MRVPVLHLLHHDLSHWPRECACSHISKCLILYASYYVPHIMCLMLCDDVLVVVEEVAFYVTATTKTSSLSRRRQALLFSCLCIENGLSHAPRTFTIRVEHLYEIRNIQFWVNFPFQICGSLRCTSGQLADHC